MTASVQEQTNKKTQEVTNERWLISTRQNNVRNFHSRSLRGRELLTYDRQQWRSAQFSFILSCVSVRPFVALSKATYAANSQIVLSSRL